MFILLNNIFSQENNKILFSQDELEIINLVLQKYLYEHPETNILILQDRVRFSNILNFNNFVDNQENNFEKELIDDFIKKNTEIFGIIDENNIFDVKNVEFYLYSDFYRQYNYQILIENIIFEEYINLLKVGDINASLKKYEEYLDIRIDRTHVIISLIGFNKERNKAFLQFFSSNLIYYGITGFLLEKNNNEWVIK